MLCSLLEPFLNIILTIYRGYDKIPANYGKYHWLSQAGNGAAGTLVS